MTLAPFTAGLDPAAACLDGFLNLYIGIVAQFFINHPAAIKGWNIGGNNLRRVTVEAKE